MSELEWSGTSRQAEMIGIDKTSSLAHMNRRARWFFVMEVEGFRGRGKERRTATVEDRDTLYNFVGGFCF